MSDIVRPRTASRAPSNDVAQIVKELLDAFGPSLLAFVMDVDTRSLHRWAAGTGVRYESEKRLRDVYGIYRLLLEKEEPPTVRAWFMGMNPQLDDLSPAEVVREASARDVMAAARAFLRAA